MYPEVGYSYPDVGYRYLDVGYRYPDIGTRMSDIISDVRYLYWMSTVSHTFQRYSIHIVVIE